jgi:hypothetical protein
MGAFRQAVALLKPAATGAVFGCILYFAADTASDIYTFCSVRRAALERVRASADVAALVGEPFRPAPWYDGALGFSHRDRVAHCTFQVVGAQRTTDVTARAARRQGPKVNFLYNAFGDGAWDLVTCQAMFPGEGGLAAPRNLMEPLPVVAAAQQQQQAAAAAKAAGECLPCQQQQGGGKAGQQQPAASGGRSWWWWWGGSSSGSSGSKSGSSSSSSTAPAATPQQRSASSAA